MKNPIGQWVNDVTRKVATDVSPRWYATTTAREMQMTALNSAFLSKILTHRHSFCVGVSWYKPMEGVLGKPERQGGSMAQWQSTCPFHPGFECQYWKQQQQPERAHALPPIGDPIDAFSPHRYMYKKTKAQECLSTDVWLNKL
jgi:hypothetical protein